MTEPRKRKIAVLGSRSVGESSVASSYLFASPFLARAEGMGSNPFPRPDGCGDAVEHNPVIGISHLLPLSEQPGKSSLVVRYVDDAFVDSYYPTIENIFNKKIKYRNQDFECDIIDTAGQVRVTPFPLDLWKPI